MMNQYLRASARALGCVCLVVTALGCSGGPGAAPSAGGGATPASGGGGKRAGGAPAPDFTLPSLDGKQVRLSDYKGKIVLIDFWSTTCDPCMVEMPHLVELYKKHKDKGFVVLAVSLDGPESRAQVNSVVHDKEMIFPVLLDEETAVVGKFNPKKEMPYTVLVDRDGNIVSRRGGYTAGAEKTLVADVEKALAD